MTLCECDATVHNTGVTSCKTLMRDSEMIILVRKYGSTGALNYIDTTATLNQAYFDGKINNVNREDRWYPLPRHKNPASERGENTYQEYDDQTRDFVHQGVRPYTFFIPKQEPAFVGKLESWACEEFGFFIVDKNRSLIGIQDVTGQLRPIAVDENSFFANYVFPTASTVPGVTVGFNFDVDEQDANLRMILATEITPVNLLNLKGLVDVYATYSGISTTGVTITLYTSYGPVKNFKKVPNLLITDFWSAVGGTASRLYNVTNSSLITIATFTETAEGVYALTFALQTVGHVIRVTPIKVLFDFSEVTKSTFVIV